MSRVFRVIAEGDYACFTRPELKVERVSYDVPTPGALEGMLKSIYWKPAIRYVVDRIVVFHPVSFINIRRNEVKDKVEYLRIRGQMEGNPKADPRIYTSESRSQRNSMILRNVRYGIEFHIEQTGLRCERERSECDPEKKHEGEFERRLQKGQFFRSPCFGCAEFPVKKLTLVDSFSREEVAEENLGDHDLGYMVDRVEFIDQGRPINGDWNHPKFSDQAVTTYYRPHMKDGVIDVQTYRRKSQCS